MLHGYIWDRLVIKLWCGKCNDIINEITAKLAARFTALMRSSKDEE